MSDPRIYFYIILMFLLIMLFTRLVFFYGGYGGAL